MLQTVDGKRVYVLDFDVMPKLPITWKTDEERPYAKALQAAIETDVIDHPGKYGICIHPKDPTDWVVYEVIEV